MVPILVLHFVHSSQPAEGMRGASRLVPGQNLSSARGWSGLAENGAEPERIFWPVFIKLYRFFTIPLPISGIFRGKVFVHGPGALRDC